MTAIWKFRLLAVLVLVFVGGASASNLAAEFLRPALPPLLPKAADAAPADQIGSVKLAVAVAPFRSDLRADYAAALASQAISSDVSSPHTVEVAEDAVRSALKIGPHDSRMWLTLALLQARSNGTDPLNAESLKMSYLTGPNRTDLVSVRLQCVTSTNSLNDPDLRDLAQGDVRAIATQIPDGQQALVADYTHASEIGKTFLEQSVRMIDPKRVDSLRSR